MNKEIAFFDFDGTITTKDSLLEFIKYAVKRSSYYLGILSLIPWGAAYKLKLIPNYRAKEKLITTFFKGWDADQFQQVAKQYSLEQIDKIIRPQAMEKISWHQKRGHTVVIVSASLEPWLNKWCQKHNIDLIATRLKFHRGKVTGRLAGKNCYGTEKVNRIRERYNLSEYSVVYAYGDSKGDRELLSLADHAYYRHFHRV